MGDALPYALALLLSPLYQQGIGKIEMFKRLSWNARTLGVEARVGEKATPVSHGQNQISVNRRCGSISSVATDKDSATFLCRPPLNGRYVTLQATVVSQMNIGEINIFKESEYIF